MAQTKDLRPDLPDFDSPPVTEVVVGVQFEPLKMLAPHIGLFWAEVRDRFPNLKQLPALEPVKELFGVKVAAPQPGLRFMDEPETPRCWFLDPSGNRLIQVQADRLIHNWRKVGDEDSYPRYATLRESFLSELKLFEAFVSRERLGDFIPNQCEVTYINHVLPSGVWENFGQLDRISPLWASPTGAFLPPPEDVRFNVRYVIPNSAGKPSGRLHMSIQPAYRKSDSGEVFALNLIARGAPDGEGLGGVARFLDTGHEWIVRGFTELTTPAMHRAWGKHGT